MDRVTIRDGLGKWFQQDDTRTFTTDEAICFCGERLAFAIRRKHARLGKADEAIRRDDHRHAASQRHLAIPSFQ